MIPNLEERRAKRKELREQSQREANKTDAKPEGELSPAYHDNPDGEKPMTITDAGGDKPQEGDANWSPNS